MPSVTDGLPFHLGGIGLDWRNTHVNATFRCGDHCQFGASMRVKRMGWILGSAATAIALSLCLAEMGPLRRGEQFGALLMSCLAVCITCAADRRMRRTPLAWLGCLLLVSPLVIGTPAYCYDAIVMSNPVCRSYALSVVLSLFVILLGEAVMLSLSQGIRFAVVVMWCAGTVSLFAVMRHVSWVLRSMWSGSAARW